MGVRFEIEETSLFIKAEMSFFSYSFFWTEVFAVFFFGGTTSELDLAFSYSPTIIS